MKYLEIRHSSSQIRRTLVALHFQSDQSCETVRTIEQSMVRELALLNVFFYFMELELIVAAIVFPPTFKLNRKKY